jgi:hypothetical protein
MAIAAVCHPEAASPLKQGRLGRLMVEVHRLRVELGCEALDVRFGDHHLGRFEPHTNAEIIEPLDLRHDFASQCD